MTESFSGNSGGYLVPPGYRKDCQTDPNDPEVINRKARKLAKKIAQKLNAPKGGFPNGTNQFNNQRVGANDEKQPPHSANPLEELQFYVPGKFA